MKARWLAVAMIVGLLGAACGDKGNRTSDEASGGSDTPAARATQTTAGGGSGQAGTPATDSAGRTVTTTTAKAASGAPSPGGDSTAPAPADPATEPGDTGANGRLPLTGTVAPQCAKRGQPIRVDIQTRAYASIGAMAKFADGEAHGTFIVGNADPTGKFVWAFSVPASAPYGKVKIDVIAEDRQPVSDLEAGSNGDNAHLVLWFTVSKSC